MRMTVGFEQSFVGASSEVIERVEAGLGITLSGDYREFLRGQNGGYLEDNFLPPNADLSVRYLYSAGPNDDDDIFDLESAAEFYRSRSPSKPQISSDYLPIGENSFDDVLCLKIRGEDSGAVYLWNHDALANTNPFERVADGFGGLFAALRPGSELDLR